MMPPQAVMKPWILAMTLTLAGCVAVKAPETVAVLDDGSQPGLWKVWPEAWGGRAEIRSVPGRTPGTAAIGFTGPGIAYRELAVPDTASWQKAGGLSFWVKGDGSPLYGTIVVGPAGKGSWEQGFVNAGMTGHAFYFPLADTAWHRVTAAWCDFIPEGPHPAMAAPGGLVPADIRVLRFGTRWKYWRNYDLYPRFSYEIAGVELTDTVPPPQPAAVLPSVDGVLAKMRRGEAVRILCAGDSITAGAGVNGGQRYWELLQPLLRRQFSNDRIVVEGWGIGGATLLDALPWIDWMLGKEPPDLVTLMFGTNDCSCYPPEYFRGCLEQFLDRAARVAAGRTAVLPFATLPGLKEYLTKTDPYAEAVRATMRARQQPFLDLSQAFKAQPDAAYAACFADGVHLSAPVQALVAETIAGFLSRPRP